MGQYTSKQWNEMTEVNKAAEKSEEQKQKQNSGEKKRGGRLLSDSLTSRVKSRVLKSGKSFVHLALVSIEIEKAETHSCFLRRVLCVMLCSSVSSVVSKHVSPQTRAQRVRT